VLRALLHRPQPLWLRRTLFQVHLWTGLATGVYVFVVCVTGAALVFRIDMQKAAFPSLFTPSAAGPLAEPAAIMASVARAFPGHHLSGIEAPSTLRPTYLAYVARGNDFLTVLIDPVSAKVLGLLPDHSWVRTVQDLHFDLLAGRTGRTINGVGGGALFAMCVTGLVIWWPGVGQWRRGFTVDWRRSWRRIVWDLHSAVGIWTVAFTAMWALTGVYFAFPAQFRAAVNVISPLSTTLTPRSDPRARSAARPSWADLIARARERVPGRFVARVVVPSNDTGAFLVMFSSTSPTPAGTGDLTSVYLDQHTGAVLQEPPRLPPTAGDLIMAWAAPLHVGSVGGSAARTLWLVVGLTLPVLFVTGFALWWLRVVRRRTYEM
jgi:uncharacterized iron-regulated membrane protein